MILRIADWEFEVDITRTMEYSAAEAAEHCTCAYCRNFYAAADTDYPELRPFLARFGLDLEAPDELMPYDIGEDMYYDGVYMVCGTILQAGKKPILDRGCLTVEAREYDQGLQIPHNCPRPFFALDVGTVIVPWVLDEPMSETLSPANEPSFLKKMWDKLLRRQGKNGEPS